MVNIVIILSSRQRVHLYIRASLPQGVIN